jgi:VPDSG-CTERM motif
MKLKHLLLTIISAALLATNAKAAIYSDIDLFNGSTGQLLVAGNTLTSTLNGLFQIDSQGYNPSTEYITSAIASFSIFDDNLLSLSDGPETVTITLGVGPGTFVNGQSATFGIGLGDAVTGQALVDLRADGVLSYSIVANSGDFRVYSASLLVTAVPKGVPDGGTTAFLLGIGFLGIYAAQRKFALAR